MRSVWWLLLPTLDAILLPYYENKTYGHAYNAICSAGQVQCEPTCSFYASSKETICFYSKCCPCPTDTYSIASYKSSQFPAHKCTQCTRCISGYFGTCSGATDTVCSKCTDCLNGEQEFGGCSGKLDMVCMSAENNCTATNNRVCCDRYI